MGDVINKGTKKVIKKMVVVAQTAQFLTLMPKPRDFVSRLVKDVVYLSGQVQKLSDDINYMIESYANIPTDYLMFQMDAISGTMTGITNRVNLYTQTGIDTVLGVGENTMGAITELTGNVIDTVGTASKAVTSLSSAIAHSSSAILGDVDKATEIYDTTEVILEWKDNAFRKVSSTTVSKLNNITQKIQDARLGFDYKVDSVTQKTTEKIDDMRNSVQKLLDNLKSQMDKLSNCIDTGFSDVTGVTSISNGASFVQEALQQAGNNSASGQIVSTISSTLSDVLKNFSISKVIKAFGGVIVQSVVVQTGLDQLPPINYDLMLAAIRNDVSIPNEDLYKELNGIIDNTYGEIQNTNQALKNIPSEELQYSSDKYDSFIKQYDDELEKQRRDIRLSMKSTAQKNSGLTEQEMRKKQLLERKSRKSAIKEMRKFKNQAKKAKQTSKRKSLIKEELARLKSEMEIRSNSIKSDWNMMMNEYRSAISEIKEFFRNGGDGDMFIEDCCDAINQDCKQIKELCSNLITQLTTSTIKVAMPSDIGSVFPNPAYKIADFWMDIKTIIKFIKDLIMLIIDILNQINKLARIMLNGVNSLSEIIQELMNIIGLQWFMDLVQNILDLLKFKTQKASNSMRTMLAPVYYRDTDEYDNTWDVLDNDELISYDKNGKATINQTYIDSLKSLTSNAHMTFKTGWYSGLNENKLNDLIDKLEDKGNDIVAYRTPILTVIEDNDNSNNVSSLVSGGDMEIKDLEFLGWYYFHPELAHAKKRQNRIIKKAANKGGVKKLYKKKINGETAFWAFFWYAYYTDDMEKDCYKGKSKDHVVYVDSLTQTENGTLVHIDGIDGYVFVKDSNVQKGDYINVNGKKYRVGN